jgi:hypothetical protein
MMPSGNCKLIKVCKYDDMSPMFHSAKKAIGAVIATTVIAICSGDLVPASKADENPPIFFIPENQAAQEVSPKYATLRSSKKCGYR